VKRTAYVKRVFCAKCDVSDVREVLSLLPVWSVQPMCNVGALCKVNNVREVS